jgi:DNA-directed RNA polymerase specialized sigma subunit
MAKKVLKKFQDYIDGDGALRKDIFAESPASQQVIFELFSQLDKSYYTFFLYFFSTPSSGFWDVLLSQLSAIASGSARNRNFCEDYNLLRPVKEVKTTFSTLKDKVTDLLGASHALWFELADPNYEEKPNTQSLWLAVYDINPNRMVWEWWFESKAREVKTIWNEVRHNLEAGLPRIEKWAKSIGLKNIEAAIPVAEKFIATYDTSSTLKHQIANPYLRLVYTITKSIAAYNQPGQFLDTFNIACTGLMRSIAKYAPSLSMAFSNFAEREIRYEIYYQLGNYNLISLPHKTWQKHREYEELRKEYYEKHGKEPSLEDLIRIYSLPKEDVYDVYRQVQMQNPHSLDQKVFNEEKSESKITLKDRIEDPKCIEARESVENQQFLHLALLRMSHKERKVFMVANSLTDIVQDIEPDPQELRSFFYGLPHRVRLSG